MISIIGISFCRQKREFALSFKGAKRRGRRAIKFVTIFKPDVQIKNKLLNNNMSIKIVLALSENN